jgi:transcription antitermination factor NusG
MSKIQEEKMKNEHTKTVAPFIRSAKKLSSGERLTIAPLSVKTEKHLVFTCDLESLGKGKILIGHGKDITATSWIEITAEEISAFAYYAYMPEPLKPLFDAPIAHGMDFFDFLTVIIDADAIRGNAFMLICSPSGMKKLPLPLWDGCNGEIFAEVQGADLENCRLSWSSDGFARKVWVLGDSYLGTSTPKRWPYYLLRDGYTNLMLSGFPGMGAQVAIEQFRTLVQKGSPEFALWCLGMNNGDKDGTINEDYLSSTEEFIAICKANNENITYLRPEEIDIKKGTKVRVHGGIFDGTTGHFVKVQGKRSRRVVLLIEGITAVALTEISTDFIEVLD